MKKVIRVYLNQLIRLPHPRRQILQGDIHSWYRLAAQQLSFVVPEDTQCNAEEHIEAIDEEDIPHPEQSLPKKKKPKATKNRQPNQVLTKKHRKQKIVSQMKPYKIKNDPRNARTSTGRQSVNRDKNQEKQIAARSTPRSVRWACSLGVNSWT